jgi:murein DD-endopeptidase MepM/ murein hydrolase activator NlpD
MIIVRRALKPRGIDAWGDGSFKAPRGKRTHKGIDYHSEVNDAVYSPVEGRVTKLGYPYKPRPDDRIIYRYVEVTEPNGTRHRVFYIEPAVGNGIFVDTDTIIGLAQDIQDRYTKPGKVMKNHVHYEIIDKDGNLIDPQGE